MSNTEFFLGIILPIVLFGALLTYVMTHGPDRKKRQPRDPKQ